MDKDVACVHAHARAHAHTHTHTHTHTQEYYLAIKKDGILPFVTTWMDLEGIMRREISQTWIRQIPYYFTYMQNLKNKISKQKQTQTQKIQRTA